MPPVMLLNTHPLRVYFNRLAAFHPCDSRICILTIEGRKRKLSVSLHPAVWSLTHTWREFRLTVLGLNLHYRAFANPIR